MLDFPPLPSPWPGALLHEYPREWRASPVETLTVCGSLVIRVIGSLCSRTGVVPRSACPPTHSIPEGTDRAVTRGLTMRHSPRCMLLNSCNHHRSVLRYRPGPGQGSCCRSRPLGGNGGTRSETEEVAVGGGPGGGVRFGVFRVLGLVDDRTGDWLHFPHCTRVPRDERHGRGARLPVADLDTLRRAISRSAVSWPASGSRWTM